MKDINEHIVELIDNNEAFVMATILNKSGSAPREEGTKMLVKKDFSIVGTIGGGILEAMAIKYSSKIFESKEFAIKEFALNNQEASSIGMICGGHLRVLLEYIDPSDMQMVDIYKRAHELRKNRTDFVMITNISEDGNYISGRDKWICTETAFYGVEDEKLQSIVKKIREDFNGVRIHEVEIEDCKYLVDPHYNFESVLIVGAGHVAQKIAELTKNLGFYTVVIDDRDEFANVERFPKADEVKVIPSYKNINDYVIINHNSYVIIVTRGHSYDKDVLAQVLKTDAKYIGMIGSKSKRNQTYENLMNEGFTSEDLSFVHCPIGITIYAQTPEEIAISITAELIKVRRGPSNEK